MFLVDWGLGKMWLAFHDLFKTSQCFTEENLLKRKKQKSLKKKLLKQKLLKDLYSLKLLLLVCVSS